MVFTTMTSLKLKVEMGEVRRARAFALSIADDAGLGERQALNLHLVVEEAVANIVNYSGATMMELSAWQEDGSLFIGIYKHQHDIGRRCIMSHVSEYAYLCSDPRRMSCYQARPEQAREVPSGTPPCSEIYFLTLSKIGE